MHNKFFIIYNHIDVISHMNNSNSNNNPNKSIKTFDCKTIYTKIPHNKLKEAMELFLVYLDVIIYILMFIINQLRGNGLSFSIVKLINVINTVIENAYIKFNSKAYKQIIDIPMGTNCAPYFANIFVHRYDKEFISYILTVNTNIAYSLKYIFRFQDDLIVFEGDDVYCSYHAVLTKSSWLHMQHNHNEWK